MAAIASFQDVRRLTERELRELLDRGRPEERVWAIWALALNSSEPAAEVETIARRAEPEPGVRRNFAVVLAAHGQFDLLVALAKRDPAAVVRAAAMQLVARIAVDGKLPTTIVTERVRSDGAEVKTAVLGTVFAGAPAWLLAIAEQLLDDRDIEVRLEACEALVRAGRQPQAIMWLEEAAEADARLALMRWGTRGRVQLCAAALANASRRLRRLLIEGVHAPTYHELRPAIGSDLSLLRALASRGPHLIDEVPLAVLVRSMLGAPGDPWISMIARRIGAVTAPDAALAPLVPELVERCQAKIANIDRVIAELRALDDPSTAIEREELDDLRDVYERTLEHAARLLVH